MLHCKVLAQAVHLGAYPDPSSPDESRAAFLARLARETSGLRIVGVESRETMLPFSPVQLHVTVWHVVEEEAACAR